MSQAPRFCATGILTFYSHSRQVGQQAEKTKTSYFLLKICKSSDLICSMLHRGVTHLDTLTISMISQNPPPALHTSVEAKWANPSKIKYRQWVNSWLWSMTRKNKDASNARTLHFIAEPLANDLLPFCQGCKHDPNLFAMCYFSYHLAQSVKFNTDKSEFAL